MRNLVTGLAALGLVSAGLHFLGIDWNIFSWTDHWGVPVGRSIRTALAIGAVAVYALSVLGQPDRARVPIRYRDKRDD